MSKDFYTEGVEFSRPYRSHCILCVAYENWRILAKRGSVLYLVSIADARRDLCLNLDGIDIGEYCNAAAAQLAAESIVTNV